MKTPLALFISAVLACGCPPSQDRSAIPPTSAANTTVSPYTQQCVGLINDDDTEVGKVHLGVVQLFDLERPAMAPRESEIIESGFLPLEALLADLGRFESWSRICLEALFGGQK